MLQIGGMPFAVVVSPDGDWSFVSLGGQVAVLSDRGATPRLVREIPLPQQTGGFGRAAGGAITHDGRYLLIADGAGAVIIDVAAAEKTDSGAVLGWLTTPPPSSGRVSGRGPISRVNSAIQVTTSADDKFAFVSLEYADEIAVFNLEEAQAAQWRPSSGFVGTITLGSAVVGMAVSNDGRWLYATSELAAGVRPSPQLLRPGGRGPYGSVSVIDVHRAETDPAASVVATAAAGCGAVRVAVSPDDNVVWVTARESDELLAFSAAALRSDPQHALLARIRVGEAPVGLTVFDGGRYVAVDDSDRFMLPGATSSLTIVDTNAALAGKPALLGTVPTGMFPRELAVEPRSNTLLVTNFISGKLETVKLPNPP